MRHPVVRFALIFGLIVAALRALLQGADVVLVLAAGGTSTPPDPTTASQTLLYTVLVGLAGILLFFVTLGLYLLAGMFTARQTGSVGSGSIAGMLTGTLAGIVGAALTIATYATGLTLPTQSSSTQIPPDAYQVYLVVVVFGAVLGIAFDIGYGAGLGALGGLIGRNSYEKAHPMPAWMPGMYAPPWAYAPGAYPGAYPPPGYQGAYPYSPYPGAAPAQQPGEPWPAAFPPPAGYMPPPPPPPAPLSGADLTPDGDR